MPRTGLKVSVAVATLLSIGAGAVMTATADAAYTWAGVWSSTYGNMTLNANGGGTYPGGGNPDGSSISGGVSGPEGRTNSGTWHEPSADGTYTFDMTEAGKAFTGTFAYTGGSCPFLPCEWNGTCLSGACLQNGPEEPPPCIEPSGRVGARGTDDCLFEVPFGFDIKRGLPAKPPRDELVPDLLSVEAQTEQARLFSRERRADLGEYLASGDLTLSTRYREAGGGISKHQIDFRVGPEGYYDKEPGEINVDAQLRVVNSSDENCPTGVAGLLKLQARKRDSGGKAITLTIRTRPSGDDEVVPCLTEAPRSELIWTTDNFRSVKIGRPRLINPD